MSNPTLFISHSTNGLPPEDRSVRLKECLCAALSKEDKEEKKWFVFIDSSISPGVKWRMEILHNLAEAHAGIILFNKRAVSESTWVRDEALILCFHKFIDPDFQVIPVLLDDKCLSETCFRQYEPFQLKEIQVITDDHSRSPEEFAEFILSKLDRNRAKKPKMSPWVQQVVGLLRNVNITALQDAAEQLEFESPIGADLWNKLGDRKQNCLCRSLVELMHHKSSLESIGAFRELLRELDIDDAYYFKKRLTAKWVPNEAMEIILCASRKPEEIGLLIVNAREQAIIDEYLNRAKIEIYYKTGSIWAFSVGGGAGEGPGAIRCQIERTIRDKIIKPLNEDDSDMSHLPQDIAERLNKPSDVAICALPPEYAREPILKELRQLYPRIIFLVQVGNSARVLKSFNAIGGIPLPPLDEKKRDELSELKSRLEAAISQVYLRD